MYLFFTQHTFQINATNDLNITVLQNISNNNKNCLHFEYDFM